MTEAEWLACTEPWPMLEFLRGRASERKLRLFAVACCRRIGHLLVDERSRKAVKIAERFADGVTDRKHLVRVREGDAREAKQQLSVPAQVVLWRAAGAAQDATRHTGWNAALNCMCEASRAVNAQDTNYCDPGELEQQARLVRCVFGNPFRPAACDPSWLRSHGGTVLRMAESVYEDRAFDRLSMLADALQEAGCRDELILNHCRQPGQHVRGCWVVDLLLGKA